MKLLDQLEIEEVENIAAEQDLDRATKLANAAELRALRTLHAIAAREHRGSLRFIQTIEGLPGVADVASWKRLIDKSRAALAPANGAPDLAQARKA